MEQTILSQFIVPAALFIIMAGLGLSLTIDDFRGVLVNRKALVVGLLGQLVLLPVFAYLLISGLQPDPVFGLGLLILALSPGGALSNAISHVCKGDLALSVSLTALTSLLIPFTLPFIYSFAASGISGGSGSISLPIGRTILQLLMITVVPILIGMSIRYRFKGFAQRAGKPVKIISVVFFLMVIFGVIKQNWEVFPLGFNSIGLAAIALNIGSLLIGFSLGRLVRLSLKQIVTIMIEVGMQNAATATFVTATLLGDVTMSIAPAIYATIMVPTALLTGFLFSRRIAGSGGRQASSN